SLRSALERIVTASGPGFGEWQWRLATLPFAFGGLGVYSAASGSNFDDALCVFNNAMEIDFLSNPNGLVAISKGRAYFGLASCGSDLWVRTDNERRAQLVLRSLRGMFMGTMLCHALALLVSSIDIVRDTLVGIRIL
ncbi:hypothetical protein Tco_0171665, partial [Tanacetum coccineum]